MNTPKPTSVAMLINRKGTRRLLKVLDRLEPGVTGRQVLIAQLRSVLARRDWQSISVEIDRSLARQVGGSIGIVQFKQQKGRT